MGSIMTMIILIMMPLIMIMLLIMMPLIMVMPMQSSYQPHLYRDRTRTKVLWRTLSFTLSTLSRVSLVTLSRVSLVTLSRVSLATLSGVSPETLSRVTLPKVSPVIHGRVTLLSLSGVFNTVASVSIISPICPYFLQDFISWTISTSTK